MAGDGADGGVSRTSLAGFFVYPGLGGNGGATLGAGIFVGAGSLGLRQTTLSGNSGAGRRGGSGGAEFAPDQGGSSLGAVLFAASGQIDLANSTIFANTATGGFPGTTNPGCHCGFGRPGDGAGGGLYLNGGSVSLKGDTVASNEARAWLSGRSYGGGIANVDGGLFINTTLMGNNTLEPGDASAGNDISGPLTSSHSLIGQTPGATITDNGGNIFDVDPGLDPNGVQFNGGPNQTVALENGSPAVDHGDNAVCSAAAKALHFPRVHALQAAIRAFCKESQYGLRCVFAACASR